MARFVLIHGAFGGGWIWGPLAGRLEAAGHEVEAPDLPGMGDDDTPVAEGTLPESTLRELNKECAPELLEWAIAKAGEQPVAPFTEPVSLNDDFERIPRSYVICTKDRAIPPALQRRMVKERN